MSTVLQLKLHGIYKTRGKKEVILIDWVSKQGRFPWVGNNGCTYSDAGRVYYAAECDDDIVQYLGSCSDSNDSLEFFRKCLGGRNPGSPEFET